ncbi:YpdA family putative bacillithiol disulfide reductase [Pseudalkalibacillus berkeleyi]|uniref:YpdA family putative bacillithiol disulfide reductase n=1 Tax=Pseudalkalibacillus berkeleyi TaxID=1069813 RepID=A0ABS9H129_9BACL|nr:YpdA family putative bacillithiol disulfide reductase [Pseudalkalibacillus berkeleyi]MCF6137601.1 YpdA family putative bacillithiol disulfide reductase [Pseudalkalibacillus berkeleyi]
MHVDAIIVGGGPCGLSTAIALEEIGLRPVIIEKGNIVNSIYNYPTHQQFFSTSEKLEIGNMPFVIEQRKPKRNQALSYYREVVKRKKINVHTFETVTKVEQIKDGTFIVHSNKQDESEYVYETPYVVIATGYYDHPNYMDVPGEDLEKVFHYFKEAHPYFDTDVVVIGGKNSAVDAALELEKVGARVTCLYRGSEYSKSVKPWILPEFDALVRHNKINMEFNAEVKEITHDSVIYEVEGNRKEISNDFVFAMTGYHPDHSFLTKMGVEIEGESGRPMHNPETMETNVDNIFISGVIAAGNNANEIFIENGRFHGERIAKEIFSRMKED